MDIHGQHLVSLALDADLGFCARQDIYDIVAKMDCEGAIIGKMAETLSVVLPFFNEQAGVEDVVNGLVRELIAAKIDYQLVLVDNGSTDETGVRLQNLATSDPRLLVVTVPENRGYGYGIGRGLSEATGTVIGYIDGDGQVGPVDLIRVYRALCAGEADFAKARRQTRGDRRWRRLVSWIFNLLFRWFFNIEALDVNAKPKLFRQRHLANLAPRARDWFIDAEIMIKAARLRLRVVEVDVHFQQRPAGSSHVRLTAICEFLNNLLRYRLGGTLRAWEEKIDEQKQ